MLAHEPSITARVPPAHARPVASAHPTTILSWNLLHVAGATVVEVQRLIDRWQPDVVLLQEATHSIDDLPERVGGFYGRVPQPGRRHGIATWSRHPFATEPLALPLPPGALIRRVCQLVDLGSLALANVHLSHGQLLNRRQLRCIAAALPGRAAVLGDFNLVGPPMLNGFRDVGPRMPTHRMVDLIPLRIDRCLARGLHCDEAIRLPLDKSDHHPILVRLRPARG